MCGNYSRAETIWGNTVICISTTNTMRAESKYRISSYSSFHPWILSSLEYFPHLYVLWPLDFQVQKRIVSAETIWGNTVVIEKSKLANIPKTTLDHGQKPFFIREHLYNIHYVLNGVFAQNKEKSTCLYVILLYTCSQYIKCWKYYFKNYLEIDYDIDLGL